MADCKSRSIKSFLVGNRLKLLEATSKMHLTLNGCVINLVKMLTY